MDSISLYIKTHNVTGLKYLGQTAKNPFKYSGSGKYWSKHIKKHGNNVSTEILSRCKTKKELEVCGLFFSKLFDVVESKEWANLRPESGEGWSGPHSEDTKKKMRNAVRPPKSKKHRLKISQNVVNSFKQGLHPSQNLVNKENTRLRMKEQNSLALQLGKHHSQTLYKCPHCEKEGKGVGMYRHHFDRCKWKI